MSRAKRRQIKKKRQTLDISLEIPEFETQLEKDAGVLARFLALPIPDDLGTMLIGDCENDESTVLLCPKNETERVFSNFLNSFPDEKRKAEVTEQLKRNRFVLVRIV